MSAVTDMWKKLCMDGLTIIELPKDSPFDQFQIFAGADFGSEPSYSITTNDVGDIVPKSAFEKLERSRRDCGLPTVSDYFSGKVARCRELGIPLMDGKDEEWVTASDGNSYRVHKSSTSLHSSLGKVLWERYPDIGGKVIQNPDTLEPLPDASFLKLKADTDSDVLGNLESLKPKFDEYFKELVKMEDRRIILELLEAGLDGVKYDTDKPRPDLIDPEFMIELSELLAIGAVKYEDDNWKRVEGAVKRYKAATLRHLFAYLAGEEFDEETGKSHLTCVTANVMFLRWFDRSGEQEPVVEEPIKRAQDEIVKTAIELLDEIDINLMSVYAEQPLKFAKDLLKDY